MPFSHRPSRSNLRSCSSRSTLRPSSSSSSEKPSTPTSSRPWPSPGYASDRSASPDSEDAILPDGPIVNVILREWDRRDFRESSDALATWLNARWRKSGYSLSMETVHAVLRSNGREAFRGLGDQSGGAFNR